MRSSRHYRFCAQGGDQRGQQDWRKQLISGGPNALVQLGGETFPQTSVTPVVVSEIQAPEDVAYGVIDANYAHHCRGGDFCDLLKISDSFEIG